MKHVLKTVPEAFNAVEKGWKKAEFRKNDREGGYNVEDILVLQEYHPDRKWYSGRCMSVVVTHIVKDLEFGIPEGYVMMSISVIRSFRSYE